jgi:phage-related protein
LKANNPTAQTFNAALAKMTGGTTSLNTILMLSGTHSQTFKDNVDKIQGSVSKTGSSVDNWDKIQGTFNQKMDRLKASVEATGISIGTALLPAVSKIASMVISVVTPVANWIAKHQSLAAIILGSLAGFLALAGAISGISKAVSLVTGTFDKLKTGFQAVAKGAGLVKDGVSKIPWSSMASGASSAWDTVSGKASDAWTAVQSGASTATSAVQDFGSKVATAASGAASSAWRTLSSGMSAATTATKAAAAATLDFSKSLIASAASGLRAAGAWALEKVQLVATTVAEKAAAAAEWLLNAAMDANPITLIILALVALAAGFAYLWTHSAAFRDFWISAWHDIESAAQTVWGWLQTAFHAMMSLIDTVVGFVRSHWPLLLAIITGPIGMAVYLITKYWSDIKKFFLEGVHTALAYLEGLAQIPVKVGAWFLSMAAKVGHGIDVAVTWVAGLPGRFMQWLGQLGQDAINVGVNFMQGLWNGLVSMASWLGSQVMGLVKDVIPGPILKVLGISSPSKWAHWAGQMVGHGLANGMSSMHDHVANASANLAKAVTKGSLGAINLAGAQVTGSLTVAAGLPAAAAGGVAINIDLRGSTVSSDADRRKLAQEIGNEVVKQVARAGIKARAF